VALGSPSDRRHDLAAAGTPDHGRTSVPGVFAAGDATTTPFKQIVIAIGEGAKASLSAFEYLIRQPEPVQQQALAA
jgi:NADH-dependent peroxiredoxin subunit F